MKNSIVGLASSFMGCFMFIIAVNLCIGGFCFDYCLFAIFGKDIPWYADMVAGLFLGELAIPATVICWIVQLCGMAAPFVH
jgi:hypothetical protein